ncbi:MAG TPA: 1,2-phenylacetyl-CoA epoxidase subunit PaaC, partial [Bacteroidia bacterium]|nr:1,2-phenylacetyl-CoA epoxidase subunit PaaC [Bacteroidia bacterium]
NNLILGQRLAEWCSNGPILEEDLAMTNISLDNFGQAEYLYEYAAELEGKGNSADDLAFLRDEREYFNNILVEQPNGDFAFTMMKEMLYSAFAVTLCEALSQSKDERLAALAVRMTKEVKYHYRHSSEWLIRLGNGTEESRIRAQSALNELWMFTADLFTMNQTDKVLVKAGISIDMNDLYPAWRKLVEDVLEAAKLRIPQHCHMVTGGIDGQHTEYLGHILCEMQYLQRAHPGAKW